MHTVCTGQTNYIVKVTQQWRHSYYRLWLHVVEVQRTGGGGRGEREATAYDSLFSHRKVHERCAFSAKKCYIKG